MNVLELFKQTGAMQTGHFLLTSGRHSSTYLQCAKVMQYPDKAAALGEKLAGFFKNANITTVVGPAVGGIIIAHETAKALGVRAVFTEREQDEMRLRRGLTIAPGERVLVVEDVITTGGSVKEVLDVVRKSGAIPVGVGLLVDRSGGRIDFGVTQKALLTLDVETFDPQKCPLCQKGLSIQKPGSRKLFK